MKRAVLWLVAGLVALVAIVVVTAPELTANVGGMSTMMVLAMAAGLPGLFLLLVFAVTRTGRHDQPGAGRPDGADQGASLTADEVRRARDDRDASGG